MKPSRPLNATDLQNLESAIGYITKYYNERNEPMPYQFKPNDPRHANMYHRAYEENAYIPVLIFIYRYGSDSSDWGPVMIYFNPKTKDSIWLHGFLRSPTNVQSLWRGLYVTDPNFGGLLDYPKCHMRTDFISLVSQIGNKESLESVITALILGQLARAELFLIHNSAEEFHSTSIDMISYPATIFIQKYMTLLIRCANENKGQLISHPFRILPWLKEEK